MTKWEGLALLGVGYLFVRDRRARSLKPGSSTPRAIDRSPPMAPSPTATIVDAPDGAHYHLLDDRSGALLGVFDTIGTANEVGRKLGYVVERQP